jgi:hypothetical protein
MYYTDQLRNRVVIGLRSGIQSDHTDVNNQNCLCNQFFNLCETHPLEKK